MDKATASLLRGSLEKSQEKLRVAEHLLQAGEYEDAVSRAYYSAFHAAQAALLTEGLTAGTHQGLVNLFGLHLVKMGKLPKHLGKFLAHLKDDRESSDYEVYSGIDQETAQHAVDEQWNVLMPIRAVDVIRAATIPMTLKPGESWNTMIKNLSLIAGLPGSTADWEYPPLEVQLRHVGDQPLLLDVFGDLNERFAVTPERSVAFDH